MICFILTITHEDAQCVERYYIEINAELRYVAWTILHDAQDAEDVVQEAFSRIIKAVDTFRKVPENKRAGYCYMVVRNLALTQYQREKKRRGKVVPLEVQVAEPEDTSQRVEALVERTEETDRLWELMERLDERYRKPLLLRYVEGMSYASIAGLLSISECNARKRVERAISKLTALHQAADTGISPCVSTGKRGV